LSQNLFTLARCPVYSHPATQLSRNKNMLPNFPPAPLAGTLGLHGVGPVMGSDGVAKSVVDKIDCA
jgi:hypothetical protein